MTLYGIIHNIHVACVILSGAGFLLRGLWMLSGSPLLRHRITRWLPHLIDTVLLLSAIALAALIRQYPFAHPWLTAKILGLIVYIVLGTIALRRGPTLHIRTGAWLAAIATYAWIVSVAITRHPFGFLQW